MFHAAGTECREMSWSPDALLEPGPLPLIEMEGIRQLLDGVRAGPRSSDAAFQVADSPGAHLGLFSKLLLRQAGTDTVPLQESAKIQLFGRHKVSSLHVLA